MSDEVGERARQRARYAAQERQHLDAEIVNRVWGALEAQPVAQGPDQAPPPPPQSPTQVLRPACPRCRRVMVVLAVSLLGDEFARAHCSPCDVGAWLRNGRPVDRSSALLAIRRSAGRRRHPAPA